MLCHAWHLPPQAERAEEGDARFRSEDACLGNETNRPESMSGWISPAWFVARVLDFGLLPDGPRGVRLVAVAGGGAGFLDGLFERFAGFARALLDQAGTQVLVILRPAGRFLTIPFPPGPFAARCFAAVILRLCFSLPYNPLSAVAERLCDCSGRFRALASAAMSTA